MFFGIDGWIVFGVIMFIVVVVAGGMAAMMRARDTRDLEGR